MQKTPLDPESLRVDTFATTPAIAAAEANADAIASRTSCPGPPYCTC